MEVEKAPVHQMKVVDRGSENKDVLSKLFSGKLVENFILDNSAYSLAQVRATFYPKFENEKSDQEVRTRMIVMVVTKGLATLEYFDESKSLILKNVQNQNSGKLSECVE